MRKPIQFLCATSLVCALAAAALQGAPTEAAKTHAAATLRTAPAVTSADLSDMMARMQGMNGRLAAAATPAEKQTLMVEQFKLIQEGVTMLQELRSRSSKEATTEHMLQQRMDMMTMLIRMMVDREPAVGAAADCTSGRSGTPRK